MNRFLSVLLTALLVVSAASCKKIKTSQEKATLPGYEIELYDAETITMDITIVSAKVTIPENPVSGVKFGFRVSTVPSLPKSDSKDYDVVPDDGVMDLAFGSLDRAKTYYYAAYYSCGDIFYRTPVKAFIPGTIDLGTGVLWAMTNIGADKETDTGDRFAWGYTTPMPLSFSKDNYMLDVNALNTLTPEMDAARVQWGGPWRMPTLDEITALANNCSSEWSKEDGKDVLVVTSKKNPKQFIMLPLSFEAGFASMYLLEYWCSDKVENSENAYILKAAYKSGAAYVSTGPVYQGMCIRPVCDKPVV